jgi:hypothetical protein
MSPTPEASYRLVKERQVDGEEQAEIDLLVKEIEICGFNVLTVIVPERSSKSFMAERRQGVDLSTGRQALEQAGFDLTSVLQTDFKGLKITKRTAKGTGWL